MNYNGSLFEIYCDESNYKIFNNSLVELNVVPKNYTIDWLQYACWKWMVNKLHFCSCKLCKYYTAYNDNPAYCHMSNKYGTPKYPSYDYAKHCQYYRTEFPSDTNNFIIDEVSSIKDDKEIYYVMIVIDSYIPDNMFITNKLDYYLSNIKNTHKIVFLCYSKYLTIKKIKDYCANNTIPIIDYEIEWEKNKQYAYFEKNKEMIERANACILFRNKGDRKYDSIIELAKQKQIHCAVVEQ